MIDNSTILITGGTGSFGNHFARVVLSKHKPHKLIIFSRDEWKQSEMAKKFSRHENIRFFIGDVRDKNRLMRAFADVDYVIHAAALKQVPTLEYNPLEALHTNAVGAANVIEAAIERKVKAVVNLSSDKACQPVNLYGATKMVAEKLFTAANAYAGNSTRFCSVRYGNVLGSRGSVLPLFLEIKKRGIKEFPITDLEMTRFWITLDQAVDLVLFALECGLPGRIYIPKIPSMKIVDMARAIDANAKIKITGIRAGEKLHEKLISRGDRNVEMVAPDRSIVDWQGEYTSDTNSHWLSTKELQDILKDGRTY